jgi:hypothetical protein
VVDAFVMACETGHTTLMELMWGLHNKSMVGTTECMSRALIAAVSQRQIEATNWLLLRDLKLFADVAKRPDMLIRASAWFSDSVVLNLCEIGIDPNFADDSGMTPVLAAAAHGRLKTLHVLIDRRAHLFARDKNDYGALHYACANDNAMVLESLLDLGLNPNELNRNGESPLMVAIGQGLKALKTIDVLFSQNVKKKKKKKVWKQLFVSSCRTWVESRRAILWDCSSCGRTDRSCKLCWNYTKRSSVNSEC